MSEVKDEFIYLSIPTKYKCVYNKLLVKLSNLGISMINDCTANCSGQNKFIITCWNMFQSACAAYALNEIKKADLLINYINLQLGLNCDIDNDEPEVDPEPEPEPITKYIVNVSSTGGGTVSGGGVYLLNEEITITATPDENYEFVSWDDGNTEPIRNIIVTSDLSFTASFKEIPKTNEILFGELDLTRFEIESFVQTSIEEKLNTINLDKSIKIIGNSINTVEFYQTKSIHYVLVPIEYVDLISVKYNSGIENQLYDKNKMDSNLYKGNIEYNHNGVIYLFLYNFSISGSVDVPITLVAKNK